MPTRNSLVVLSALIFSACDSAEVPAPGTVEDAVEWVGALRLEETESSLVAQPNLRPDPQGGWLYWDSQVQEARRYGPDGDLLVALGGPGEGPGEFKSLTGLARLAYGRLVTLDSRGHIAIWTDPGELEGDYATGIASPRGLVAVSASQVAVVLGPQQTREGVRGVTLQSVDAATGRLGKTLASIPLAPEYFAAASSVQSNGPQAYRDSVLVMLLDSAWAVPATGGKPRGYSLRGPAGDSIEPILGGDAARAGVRDWLERSVFLGDFGRLSDGSWVVGTYRVRDNQIRHGLRRIGPQGEALWELSETPRLLTTGPDDLLYFADPAGLDPAKLQIGRLRQ